MNKIYKRETLISNGKIIDDSEYVRQRDVIMNFRVSEEERDKINKRIKLSGLSKQEFFISSCMNQSITVIGNIKSFDAIRKEMRRIDEKLRKIITVEDLDDGILDPLITILQILNSFYKQEDANR